MRAVLGIGCVGGKKGSIVMIGMKVKTLWWWLSLENPVAFKAASEQLALRGSHCNLRGTCATFQSWVTPSNSIRFDLGSLAMYCGNLFVCVSGDVLCWRFILKNVACFWARFKEVIYPDELPQFWELLIFWQEWFLMWRDKTRTANLGDWFAFEPCHFVQKIILLGLDIFWRSSQP